MLKPSSVEPAKQWPWGSSHYPVPLPGLAGSPTNLAGRAYNNNNNIKYVIITAYIYPSLYTKIIGIVNNHQQGVQNGKQVYSTALLLAGQVSNLTLGKELILAYIPSLLKSFLKKKKIWGYHNQTYSWVPHGFNAKSVFSTLNSVLKQFNTIKNRSCCKYSLISYNWAWLQCSFVSLYLLIDIERRRFFLSFFHKYYFLVIIYNLLPVLIKKLSLNYLVCW